jgi:large subunit ribosomal protein L3
LNFRILQQNKIRDLIDVSMFVEGEFVDVQGVSKGKGLWNVTVLVCCQATHGQHNRLRAPGSVGASSYPSRVFKGMRMAGRMGGENVNVQTLEF